MAKRGRPPKSNGSGASPDPFANDNNAGIIDGGTGSSEHGPESIGGLTVESIPDTGDTASGGESGRRKPGRPAGSKSAVSSRTIDLETLTSSVQAVHEIADLITGWELQLGEDECQKLAKALLRLQKHYPNVDVPAKALAWGELIVACQQVYGTRILAAWNNKRNRKKQAVAQVQPVAVPIRQTM